MPSSEKEATSENSPDSIEPEPPIPKELPPEVTEHYDAAKVAKFVRTSKDPFVKRANCCSARLSKRREIELERLEAIFKR